MKNHYSITDLNGFANMMRESVADSFSENYNDDLDNFITVNQTIGIIREYSKETDEEDNLLITDDIFNQVFDSVRVWIYEVALAKLAADGLVECAWNDETDAFEFWLAEKVNNE